MREKKARLSKSETFYLIASIVLAMMIAGLFFMVRGETEVAPASSTLPSSQTLSTSSSAEKVSKKDIEKDLKDLENNPSSKSAEALQKKIDTIEDKKLKKEMQGKLDLVLAEIAVSDASSNPTQTSIQEAQEAIDKLASSDEKTDLQGQLDAISGAGSTSDPANYQGEVPQESQIPVE